MLFQEYLPCSALVSFIHRYTFIKTDAALSAETCVPDGFVKLFLSFNGNGVMPQYAGAGGNMLPWGDGFSGHPDLLAFTIRIPAGLDGLMCTFYPSGFFRLFRTPVYYLNNDILDPQAIVGKGSGTFPEQLVNTQDTLARVALLNDHFTGMLSRLPRSNKPSVTAAEQLLLAEAGNINIDELADSMATSNRTLRRMFYEQTGVSPKFYARVLRINKAFRLKKEGAQLSGADIAYRCGYADQSHYIREFREFTGGLPSGSFIEGDHISKKYLGRTPQAQV